MVQPRLPLGHQRALRGRCARAAWAQATSTIHIQHSWGGGAAPHCPIPAQHDETQHNKAQGMQPTSHGHAAGCAKFLTGLMRGVSAWMARLLVKSLILGVGATVRLPVVYNASLAPPTTAPSAAAVAAAPAAAAAAEGQAGAGEQGQGQHAVPERFPLVIFSHGWVPAA